MSRQRLLGVAAGSLLALGLVVYGTLGLVRVQSLLQELETMEQEMATLRAQTQTLSETVDKLRHDPAYIEKLAREDLGWVREGETVLKFPSSQGR
ncbi:MAG: FtsB family cell division protein [Candidatus Rokuibacteriota bacterium]